MNNRFYVFLLTALCTIQSNIFTMDPSKFDDEPSSDEERLDLNATPQPQPQQTLQNNDANQNQVRTEQRYAYASAHASPCAAFASARAEPENVDHFIDLRTLRARLNTDQNFLAGKNFNGANLAGLDLSNANLTDTKLNGANLSATNLTNATLERTELKGAILNGTILLGTKFKNADLSGAQITNVIFCKVEISHYTKFINSTIKNVAFAFAIIAKDLDQNPNPAYEYSSDFSNAKLTGISITSCTMKDLKMQHITIEEIVMVNSLLRNINLVLARINKFSIQECLVIDNLDLSYAIISTGEVKGGLLRDMPRTQGITEHDTILEIYSGMLLHTNYAPRVAGSAAVGIVFTPIVPHLLIRSYFKSFDEYMEKYGISNINSILLNCNFHCTSIGDVCFSNLKLSNCINIANIKMAIGCTFRKVFSSNPQDLIDLMNKGANVGDEYSKTFEFLWAGTDYEGFLKRLTNEFLANIAHGAINGAFGGQNQ